MGEDSIKPFLTYENKWVIILALTSNEGALSFQKLKLQNNKMLYESVLEDVSKWGNLKNTMYVVGATKSDELKNVRRYIPDHFLLIPGVGAQGGDLREVIKNGRNKDVGLIINSSRGIIYAGNGRDFDDKAHVAAKEIQQIMANFL